MVVGGTSLDSENQRLRKVVVGRTTRAFANGTLHCVLSQVDGTRIEALLNLERIPLEWLTVRGQHAANATQRSVEATVSQGLIRSEEHTSELQSLMRISYAVFCLKKKNSYL